MYWFLHIEIDLESPFKFLWVCLPAASSSNPGCFSAQFLQNLLAWLPLPLPTPCHSPKPTLCSLQEGLPSPRWSVTSWASLFVSSVGLEPSRALEHGRRSGWRCHLCYKVLRHFDCIIFIVCKEKENQTHLENQKVYSRRIPIYKSLLDHPPFDC